MQNNTAAGCFRGGVIFFTGVSAMPENRKDRPKGPYYDGRAHFSYNNDLAYNTHSFMAHETVQGMVKRAEKSMADNQFKG